MKKIVLFLALLNINLAFTQTQNDNSSKFVWGAGPLIVVGNDYRGSDQSKIWFFPIPYFSYTSKRIEAEPSFIRGLIFHTKRFSFKLSIIPGLNVDSSKNRARQGMPNVDYSIEVGPMAIFHLWQSNNGIVDINLEWPVRE